MCEEAKPEHYVKEKLMKPCPGDLKTGEYVFACKFGDADWNDPWCIGFVGELGKDFITLTEHDGKPIKGFSGSYLYSQFRRITREQGEAIIREYRIRQGSEFDEAVRDRLLKGEGV